MLLFARLYIDELDAESTRHLRRNNFPRQLTETLVNTINFITDTDGEWTKQLIEEYAEIDDKGPGMIIVLFSLYYFPVSRNSSDGDVPEQPPFAQDMAFWEITFISAILGAIMGACALLFMNIVDYV